MAKVRDCLAACAWTKRLDSTFDHFFSGIRCSVLVFGCSFRKPIRLTFSIRFSNNHFRTGFSPPYPICVAGGVHASIPLPLFSCFILFYFFANPSFRSVGLHEIELKPRTVRRDSCEALATAASSLEIGRSQLPSPTTVLEETKEIP